MSKCPKKESDTPKVFSAGVPWVKLFKALWIIDPAILVPEKKVNFFWAPIQKAHEYVLNLRRQLSSSLASVAAHRSKFGIFTVTKHPSIRAFVPKKSNLKFFCVPDELGSQIVLRI